MHPYLPLVKHGNQALAGLRIETEEFANAFKDNANQALASLRIETNEAENTLQSRFNQALASLRIETENTALCVEIGKSGSREPAD